MYNRGLMSLAAVAMMCGPSVVISHGSRRDELDLDLDPRPDVPLPKERKPMKSPRRLALARGIPSTSIPNPEFGARQRRRAAERAGR